MTSDRMEYSCTLEQVDLPEIHLSTEGAFEPDDRVVVYLDELGRLEGDITGKTENGFAFSVDMTKPRLVKINEKLGSLQARDKDENAEPRRHSRIEPSSQTSHLTLSDGRTYPCEVVDISISGAAIDVEVIPSVGTYVMLGKMRGRVTRILENGIAVEFVKMLEAAKMPA